MRPLAAPVKVNDDATTNKWHWFGTFSVAPNGRLDSVWYDTRNAGDNLRVSVVLFLQHRCRFYVVAERPGKRSIQSYQKDGHNKIR